MDNENKYFLTSDDLYVLFKQSGDGYILNEDLSIKK